MPADLAADRYVIVRTDTGDTVWERGLDANNTRASAAPVQLRAADLRVTAVTAPAAAQPSQTVTVTWTVTNEGAGPARGAWTDRVLVSPDGTLTGAIALREVTRTGDLAPDGTYTGSAEVIWPGVADGTWRVVVVTDVYGAVYEAAQEGDNTTAAATATAVTHPDLSPTAVSVPATALAGGTLTVSWQDRDLGTAAVSGPWSTGSTSRPTPPSMPATAISAT